MFQLGITWVLFNVVAATVDVRREDQGLTEVPSDIPIDTERLFLASNAISHVSSDDFLSLGKLFYIDLGFNDLTVFPNFSSVALTLTELSFYRNNISSVPAAHLNIITKLTRLDLSYNQITSLPNVGGIWQPQATGNLQHLFFRENDLTTVPVLYDYNDAIDVGADGNSIVCDQRVAWLLRASLTPGSTCSAPEAVAGMQLNQMDHTDLISNTGELFVQTLELM